MQIVPGTTSARRFKRVLCTLALFLVGVSTATSQTLVGSLEGGEPQDLVVVGNTLYVADNERVLAIIDTSDPSSPQLISALGKTGTENGVGIAVVGQVAYVAVEADGVMVVDVTDPSTPTLITTITGLYAKGVAIQGNLAFVADQDFGLRIYDISTSAAPALISSVATFSGAFDVTVEGDYVYIADNDFGLVVVDITNPTSPAVAGTFEFQSTRGVAVREGMVYVGDSSTYDSPVGLRILDFKTPSSPVLVGQLETAGEVGRLKVAGDVAYLTSWPDVEAISVADPSKPRHLMTYATPGWACGLAVDTTYLYVADCDAVRIYGTAIAENREDVGVPQRGYRLSGVSPNPSRSSIDITYETTSVGPVTVEIFDVTGRKVATVVDEVSSFGKHVHRWQHGVLPAGLYIVQLRTAGGTEARKVTLL